MFINQFNLLYNKFLLANIKWASIIPIENNRFPYWELRTKVFDNFIGKEFRTHLHTRNKQKLYWANITKNGWTRFPIS
ncbi:hypothetical protein DHD05_15965 [Arenibacter sp. N53]|nr:hypothetical protein [Arenibacter sp. N53]